MTPAPAEGTPSRPRVRRVLQTTMTRKTTAISQMAALITISAKPQPPAPSPYSYRSASIESRRDALNAGYIPKKMPTDAENPRPIANDHHGNEIGKPEAACTP